EVLSPALSVTLSWMLYVPAVAKMCVMLVTLPPIVPSPKLHACRIIVPSGSLDAEESKVTVAPGFGLVGEVVKVAMGGMSASTVLSVWLGWRLVIAMPFASLAEPVAPLSSTTLRVTSKVPGNGALFRQPLLHVAL